MKNLSSLSFQSSHFSKTQSIILDSKEVWDRYSTLTWKLFPIYVFSTGTYERRIKFQSPAKKKDPYLYVNFFLTKIKTIPKILHFLGYLTDQPRIRTLKTWTSTTSREIKIKDYWTVSRTHNEALCKQPFKFQSCLDLLFLF